MKQGERSSKIYNILLPWQLSRFDPSLIGNAIISFFTSQPQWDFYCSWLTLAFIEQQSEIVN